MLPKVAPGPLRDYYTTPFPNPDWRWDDVPYLALDFETTGLNRQRDDIVSIGFVDIVGGLLRLGSCEHHLVRPNRDMPEASAVVHGILDDEAQDSEELGVVLPRLLAALAGKVMVAHNARVEIDFLSRACRRVYGAPFFGPVVDTLALEVHSLNQIRHVIARGDLRLANARIRYGLPRYPLHNALIDALSAGELFLAQVAHRKVTVTPKLSDLALPL